MRPNVTRANFLIPTDEWTVFKLVSGRHMAFDVDKKTTRQANASDVLREFIVCYIDENLDDVKVLIEQAEKYKSPILSTLKGFLEEEEEK